MLTSEELCYLLLVISTLSMWTTMLGCSINNKFVFNIAINIFKRALEFVFANVFFLPQSPLKTLE